MPTFHNSIISPPKLWQEFESLCCDLWKEIWNDPTAHKNGRGRQSQNGVDIYGKNHRNNGGKLAGVQCKGKENYNYRKISKSDVKSEVDKAKHLSK